MQLNNKPLEYIKGLDGIRALAAFLVISTHWPSVFLSLKFGWIGVQIFFVLSGFLITRILINSKEKKFKDYISRFYYNRLLRIFPIYYLHFILLFGVVFLIIGLFPSLKDGAYKGGYDAITKDWFYYFTYTLNIRNNVGYFITSLKIPNHYYSHIWSLCVEEQFYLVFPFIVYFLSIKNIKRVVVAILIICPLLRLWAALFGINVVNDHFYLGDFFYTNTFCQSDSLCTGAALALFNLKIIKPYLTFFFVLTVWLLVGLVCFYFLRKEGYVHIEVKSFGYNYPGFWFEEPTKYQLINIRSFYQYSLVNLLAVAIILPAINGHPLFPHIFLNPFVSYLGKISYGVYLYHAVFLEILFLITNHFGGFYTLVNNHLIDIILFILYNFFLIYFSHLSYQYFEKKILVLKKHSS